jgi:hypothetical protein
LNATVIAQTYASDALVAAYLTRQTPGLRIVAQAPPTRNRSGSASIETIRACSPSENGALASLNSDGTYRSLAAKWNLAEQT